MLSCEWCEWCYLVNGVKNSATCYLVNDLDPRGPKMEIEISAPES